MSVSAVQYEQPIPNLQHLTHSLWCLPIHIAEVTVLQLCMHVCVTHSA